ncbi:WhiB family transcriptional regulator [Streptomyces sp. NBC_00425]|uniref:WhiB family transcriptional regulator n=1 Tax=Streptomyces sp. NBC_00425 TaxID=2975740 RepID=UPI002E1B80B6
MRSRFSAPESLPRPAHWDDNAECRQSENPDYWFAEGNDPEAIAERLEAKRVCQRCPVRPSCLHDALDDGRPGVWGGLDQDERAALVLLRPTRTEDGGHGAEQHTATG